MPRAAKKTEKKSGPAKPRARRTKKAAAAPGSIGLAPNETVDGGVPPSVVALENEVASDGGAVIGRYREPFGACWVLVVALPIERVAPTPYQRDASPAHVERLADVVSRCGRYLDPIIVVRSKAGTYWTPNGNHRLHAMRKVGAKTIIGLLVPEREVAFQILALNTEKAHNLREKSLEVIRMYRALIEEDPVGTEEKHALSFAEPSLITLGLCYEKRPRFSGGAYQSPLKRVEGFIAEPLSRGIEKRESRARKVLELDDEVSKIVERLKSRGMQSPYLKAFVMGRVNYLRFVKGDPPPFDQAFDTMVEKAKKFDPEKVRTQDLASAGGPPDEAE